MKRKMYLVTNSDGYFAQKKFTWESLDICKIEALLSERFEVKVVDFLWLSRHFRQIKGALIWYTSSQRGKYKYYIEDILYFLKEENILLPSYECLKSHENKGYQVLLSRKLGIDYINADYFGDYREIPEGSIDFPCVVKTTDGASSLGVELAETICDIEKFVKSTLHTFTLRNLKNIVKKYVLWKWVNSQREKYLAFGEQPIVIQEFIPDLKCDYKVLVFSQKYYVLKRDVGKGTFKASGSGNFSRDIPNDILNKVLDKSRDFVSKLPAPFYSLDLCIVNGKPQFIEFQMTHLGPITMSESEFYFEFDGDKWHQHREEPDIERIYCQSIIDFVSCQRM